MRNLKLCTVQIEHLSINHTDIIRCIQINKNYFILSKNNVHLVQNGTDVIIKDNVKTIDWIPIENILYMGNGLAFDCYNVETEEINTINIAEGYVEHEWNPSQDRVSLIDENRILKIVLLDAYNSQCTVIGEYQLDVIENSPFINLGWGSKTTQFRGSAGKFSGNQNIDNKPSYDVDNSFRISWRDDGDMFAVGFARNNERIFKIFSCECEFLYENENKLELCTELAWKPDGSLLVTESCSTDGHSLAFFEKNGLYRYNLKLYSNIKVKKIQWSPNGDILMVWQESDENSEISLWTCSNFKWYLKQNLVFNHNHKINYCKWTDKKCLEVLTSNNLIKYCWKWVTLTSDQSVKIVDDIGSVVVIDGNILRVTVTTAQIIPPPYSSYNIEFSRPIMDVAFGYEENNIGVILNDYTFKLFKLSKATYSEQFSGKLKFNSIPLTLNNFIYDDKQFLLYCVESLRDKRSVVYKNTINILENQVSSSICFESSNSIIDFLRVFKPHDKEYYLGICYPDQILLCLLNEQSKLIPTNELVFVNDSHEGGGHYNVLCILNRFYPLALNGQHLYFDGNKIANNVSSYLLYGNYLLLTTTDNKLLCIKLSENGIHKMKSNNLSNVYTRSLPSGALLISIVPETRKIIFQVPRGEIEIVNPRILAVDEIDRLLRNKKYFQAFQIMRTDRINPNLLYDLNPSRFLNNIEDFIKSIHNCEYLDVFLTQLQDINVSEELYCNCFEETLPVQHAGSKLFTIANKFIEVMVKIDVDYYLQSIVTAYLCKGTDEDFENALELISLAKEREKNGIQLRVPVDHTLEHMIIISSVEKLYNLALGMDKLELIMWIASKSQLDPLEYIPFLRELVGMENNYRNYKINCHIKRYEKAFTFLIKCDNVLEELEELVTKNDLYKLVLKYLKPDNQWYKPLMHLYGVYLNKEGQNKESGFIFMRINALEFALDNFVKGCCMEETLTVFHLLGSNVLKFNSKLLELTARLIDNKQFKDASFIHDTIFNNYEESISILVKGHLWSEAFYLAYKNNRLDIIASVIKPAIVIYIEDLYNNLTAYKDEFLNLKNRLSTIRNEKIKEIKSNAGSVYEDGEYTENVFGHNIDLESVVSTTYSRTSSQKTKNSQFTSATARRKKRIEKKILQIRKGSAFENIAIIRRLYIIITEIQNFEQEIYNVCTQFFSYTEYYKQIETLNLLYEEVLILTESSKETIWPQQLLMPLNPITVEAQVYSFNMEHLDIQYRIPPPDRKNKYKIIFTK